MSSDSSNNTNNDSIINIGKEDESSVKKRVSPVYQYFTFNDELSRWYCDYCAKDFGDNTSNLWRHIKKIHSEILGESEKTNSNNNEKPTQHGFRKKLLQWVVRDDQPFITIECQEFKNMVKYLWPSVNVPSANTLRRDLSANFEQVKDKVRLELQETPGLLSFTVDAWTSKNQLPFLGISVHWINKKWELQSLTLDFCLLSGQHSGENLAQQFLKVLEDFNIETKLLAIGCDNASNMDVMLNKISSSLRSKNILFNPNNQRVRCFAHIINLAAKKAVENLYISDLNDDDNLDIGETTNELMSVIYKLRKLVVRIRASPQRRERFQQQCVAIELPELELLPDIKTRWNSTEIMIERALKLRQALHNFTSADRDLKHYLFSDNEWKLIEEIHLLMQYFKICSDYITGQLYPTLAFTIPAYNYLLDKIEDIIDNNNIRIEIKNAATAAKKKLKNIILLLKTIFFHIFSKNEKTERDDELKSYFREPTISKSTDVLAWWKVQEANYPNLSKMALDYLAIPATSAPVERIFSSGTDLVTQKRCSLKGETIRELMCLKSWWKLGFNEPIIIKD
ncbi:zinc finger BED domain-containing protein 1-like [Rhizophagus irregularis DAOM 181602=DAOM 197198]|nr:zinc finger BED domain-containing protein 1-like [Rhizophagus irregularis DAOM 181602=DAOM 197198]